MATRIEFAQIRDVKFVFIPDALEITPVDGVGVVSEASVVEPLDGRLAKASPSSKSGGVLACAEQPAPTKRKKVACECGSQLRVVELYGPR